MNEKNFSTSQSLSELNVINFYDQYADFWDDRFGNEALPSSNHFFSRRLNSFLEILGSVSSLSQRKAVELGVGTGVYIEQTASVFQSIVAVDGSKNMIEKLKLKLNKLSLTNVSPIVSSVNNIHLLENKLVDLVYFFGLIEHIIERDAFVKEINRILKPGGHIVGVTPNGKSPWYKIRVLIRGTGKHCSTDHYYTKNELKNLFERHGFVWEKHTYWGLVYAGLSNSFIYKIFSFLEPILEKSPFAFLLGGITFKVSKPMLDKIPAS